MKIALLGACAGEAGKLRERLQARLEHSSAHLLPDDPAASGVLADANLVLLLGLPPNHTREHATDHQALRALLQQHALPFALVYGEPAVQLKNALQAIAHAQGQAQASPVRSNWRWACEKCSDPACEHRLFGELLQKT